MITSLITLFSSGAVGSLIGLIGGYFNRKLDLEAKKVDHAHDLAKMDKDLIYMEKEYEQRTKIALVEAEGKTEVAGYEAMAASYDYAPVEGNGFGAAFARMIRPFITLAFFFLTVYIFIQLNQKISISILSSESMEKVYLTVIEWILFQAGITIGWWFANRQSGPSILGKK